MGGSDVQGTNLQEMSEAPYKMFPKPSDTKMLNVWSSRMAQNWKARKAFQDIACKFIERCSFMYTDK